MNPARRQGHVKIKPPKRHGPEFDLETTWSELSKNIREIFNKNASSLSFEENHRYAYNMVLHKHGDALYNGVGKLIVQHLDALAKDEITPAFPVATGSKDSATYTHARDALLKIVTTIWQDYISSVTNLSQVLKYMDRVYVKGSDVPDTCALGCKLFLTHIIRPPIKDQIVSAILKQIEFDRDGFAISPATIKGCVGIFLSLQNDDTGIVVYKTELEPAIVEASQSYYQDEGARLVESCDAPEFLRRVEDRFQSEYNRVHLYLSPQTWFQIEEILNAELLRAHLQVVLSMPNSGLETMLDLDRLDDLSRTYRLYTRVSSGLSVLKRALKASILKRGQNLNPLSSGDGSPDTHANEDIETPKNAGKGKARALNATAQTLVMALKWVEEVLTLKDKFDRIWKEAFESDREVESSMNEAFASFINTNKKAPEFISLFIDDHLKRGLKGKSDEDVDVILDKTITIFRYVTEKDLFDEFYKSHLAKRLLLGRSVSDDAERGMLTKLKVECGFQFTQKMEGMFHDMKISVEHMDRYKSAMLAVEIPPQVDLNVIVMTASFWPMQHSKSGCHIPKCLQESMTSFEKFYYSQHSGRRLTWQYSLGNVDVRANFAEGNHDLNVSTFAVVILLLFQDLGDDDFLEYEEIQNATGIDTNELSRNLQSLACAKYKILLKHPPGKDIDSKDSFSFNNKFKCPLQKIKINTISASSRVETAEEGRKTLDNVDAQRKFQIEASIVRVMKDRKNMTHNNLLNEVAKQLGGRFKPDPGVIKKRIEDLIDREYLERCDDKKSYNYLA